MKRLLTTTMMVILTLTLCSCGRNTTTPSTTTSSAIYPTSKTTTTTATHTQPSTSTSTTSAIITPTESNIHSRLYIPGVSVEDVIAWFNEIVLNAEVVISGDATLVQKWVSPISYRIIGETTEQDRQVLKNFTDQLNTIPGFPGIHEVTEPWQSNMNIYFCPQSEFSTHVSDGFENTDGAITFWYNDANQIYDAIICYRTDLDQYVRNSVLLEEIYNGLGPIQDTSSRSDSIIFSGYSTPQTLTQEDWLLLELLYHPDIVCGMTADQCERIIRTLYY